MLQALRDHPKRECLNLRDGSGTVRTVNHHPRTFGHFGNPPAIVLTLEFDLEAH